MFTMTYWCKRPSAAMVGVLMTIFMYAIIEVTSVERRDESHKFTIEELMTTHFEHKDSGDLGMDPCKAGE